MAEITKKKKKWSEMTAEEKEAAYVAKLPSSTKSDLPKESQEEKEYRMGKYQTPKKKIDLSSAAARITKALVGVEKAKFAKQGIYSNEDIKSRKAFLKAAMQSKKQQLGAR